jgi:hypothetical protein
MLFLLSLDCGLGKLIDTHKGEGVGTSNFRTTTGHFFQNVKIVFLVHHYFDITTSKLTKITTTKVVDHYSENHNVEKNEKIIESLSFV